MGKRGPKPKGKVRIRWTSNFAYAIGLIVSDGNLSPDGRHISFISKDIEQIDNFKLCLEIEDIKIGKNFSGYEGSICHRIQFGDVLFYIFLLSIGLAPAKSKSIGGVLIPDRYFVDFLRGFFDGDGSSYSYWDPRWRSSFMFYTEFASASYNYIFWLRNKIFQKMGIFGHVTKDGHGSTYQLKYAKKESIKLLKKMYYKKGLICLSRKYLKNIKILDIIDEKLPGC